MDRTLLSSNKDKFSFTMSHKKMLRCVSPKRRDAAAASLSVHGGRAALIILAFPFQFQDPEASDQLRRFRILAKPEGQQVQARERRIRVRLGRGGAEDRRVPHQAEKDLDEEGSVP